jgi:hypothetical protein
MATGGGEAGSETGIKRKAHNKRIWSATDRRIYERRRDFFMTVCAAAASLPETHEAAILSQ